MPSAFKDLALVAHDTFLQSVNIKIFNLWSGNNLYKTLGLDSVMLRSQKGICQQRKTTAPLQIPLPQMFFSFLNRFKDLVKISQLK